MGDGLRKKRPKAGDRGIGIGIGLKIRDVAAHRPFVLKAHPGVPELGAYGQCRISGKIAGASGTAEDAASGPDRTIPVGTGHTTVQGQSVYLLAETLF